MAFSSMFGGSDAVADNSQSVTLQVSGMKCAGCVQSVERQLLRLDGVSMATVNLVTQRASVEFVPSVIRPESLAESLTDAGFESQVVVQNSLTSPELPTNSVSLRPLLWAIALVFFSVVGHVQDVLPINLPIIGSMTFHCVLATLAIAVPGRPIIVSGTKGLLHNQPTMDTLVSLGSVIAYVVSVTALILPGLGWDCFFDATVMIIGLILLGRTLEEQAKDKAKSSFQALLSLQSPTARLLPHESPNSSPTDGTIGHSTQIETALGADAQLESVSSVPISTVTPGDYLQVLVGDHFPVDGVMRTGKTLVDESMLTGESRPVPKTVGDSVTAGTLNQQGLVVIEATRTGAETTLAKITRLVEEAQTRKAPIQRLADQVAGYFTYGVMTAAALTFLFWWSWGTHVWPEVLLLPVDSMPGMAMSDMGRSPIVISLKLAIAVLVIACPCALGLATPTAILVGTSLGAERGLLLRGGDVLERCSQLKTIVFDKTGTLTTGTLTVSDCFLSHNPHPIVNSEQAMLNWVASVEQSSSHPLAQAILAHPGVSSCFPVDNIQLVSGAGVVATYQSHQIEVGSLDWLRQQVEISDQDQQFAERLMAQGKTVIYCAVDRQLVGGIALQDVLRQDAKQTLENLKQMGLNVRVLTGDRLENTQVLLQELDLSSAQIDADLSPSEKANRLEALQIEGPVAMVGDGINDAPALAQADVGIALSSGTDVAMETAQIVLTRSQVNNDQILLSDIVQALRLSRATFRKIKQNLFWAFIYNLLAIPVAAGLLFPMFHLTLSPSASAALMAFSSVSVIGNSILLQTQWRSSPKPLEA
ncbi:MAG: heavy metal translocating P-type ATPase [Cyanobacteria bacterium P01_F01_bin.42]